MITLAGSPTIHVHVSQMEWKVQEHELVRSAVIGGEGRYRPYLLVELTNPPATLSPKENAALVQQLGAVMAEANKFTIPEAHLQPDLVIIATTDRPFKRVPKGSVDRKNTQVLFEDDVDRLYAKLSTGQA
jgi:hypothetical protein